MDFFIEFGDFKIADLFISSGCVEFPPAWSKDSKFNEFKSQLTFFTPEDCCSSFVNEQEMIFTTLTAISGHKVPEDDFMKLTEDNKFSNPSNEDDASIDSRFAFIKSPPTLPSRDCGSLYANEIKEAGDLGTTVNGATVIDRVSNPDFLIDADKRSGFTSASVNDSTLVNHVDDNYTPIEHNTTQMNVTNGYGVHADDEFSNSPGQENGIVDSTTEGSNGDYDMRRKKPHQPRVRSKPIFVKPKYDPHAEHFANEIANLRLVVKPQALMPRGLINPKNWCYVNATLQALLVCPPFFHMLKKLSFTLKFDRRKTSTPIMDSFVSLAAEFKTIPFPRCLELKYRKLIPGPSFTPYYVYDMLTVIQSSLAMKGGQQDAEEFLSCILNGFHEEILSLFDLLYDEGGPSDDETDFANLPEMNGHVGNPAQAKTLIFSRPRSSSHTPISNIFRGELCTVVIRPEQRPSESYEPFFTLPIDVPTGIEWSIEDAIYSLTEKENFDQTSAEPSVFRHQTIDTLPPILILHLKRFIYDKSGGLLKVNSPVYFRVDLKIHNDWLTDSAKQRYEYSQKMYKLFAVVYHHGEKATGGHYSTDVFHIGKSSWLRIDDQKILPVHISEVTKHSSNRTPYLLYFRQMYT